MKKSVLTGALAAFALTAVPSGGAVAMDDVSIRLNWYLVGFHTPLYWCNEQGMFQDAGINLTINEGRGSGVANQIVGAGDDTFGMSDSGTMIVSAVRGIPVMAVMSPMNVSPFGVISLAEAGIKTAKDLEGKRLAVTAGDALTQLFPAVIEANGLDRDKIDMVFVDPAGKVVSVLEKKADALLGSQDAQYFQIEDKGADAAALNFADIGVPTVGMTIIARRDTVEEKPDMVRRFVEVTQKCYEAAQDDPEAMVEAAMRAKPDQSKDVLLGQLKVNLGLLQSAAAQGKPIGYGAPEDWDRTLELMKKYREISTDEPATFFYTNEFVPGQ